MGVNGNSRPIGTRRTSYPSGPWVDDHGRPAKSPNQTYEETPMTAGNPNPKRWKFEKVLEVGKFLIVKLRYPDCTNFEGNKVLVIEDTLLNLINCTEIDPHFYPGGKIVARFVPTDAGWAMAVRFANQETQNAPAVRSGK